MNSNSCISHDCRKWTSLVGAYQYADRPKSHSFSMASCVLSVSRKFSGLMSLQQRERQNSKTPHNCSQDPCSTLLICGIPAGISGLHVPHGKCNAGGVLQGAQTRQSGCCPITQRGFPCGSRPVHDTQLVHVIYHEHHCPEVICMQRRSFTLGARITKRVLLSPGCKLIT